MAVSFWVQYTARETLPFILSHSTEMPHRLKHYGKIFIKTMAAKKMPLFMIAAIMSLSVCFTYLIFIYAPVHIARQHTLSLYQALIINTLAIAAMIILTPCFGAWSDRYGRKPFLIAASLIFLLFAYPFFWVASHGNFIEIATIQCLLAVAAAAVYGIAPVVMVELIPIQVRAIMVGVLYNVIVSLVGGSVPILALSLIQHSQSPTAPAFIILFYALIALIALMLFKEPQPIETENDAPSPQTGSNAEMIAQSNNDSLIN